MHVTPRAPFGAEITGIDLSEATEAQIDALARTVSEHGVAVIRGQSLDDAAFAALLTRMGRPIFTEGETPVDGQPMLNVVTNAGRTTPPRSVFHSDTSYVSRPPSFTALRPVTLPAGGGATVFADGYAAAERLGEDGRARLSGVTVRHGVTGVADTGAQERVSRHPLLRRHPVTGRAAVFLSTPERCGDVEGLPEGEDGDALIARLYAEMTEPARCLAHDWRGGDLLIWDNRCTMHKADHSAVEGLRTLHRGMVQGEAPVAA